MKTIGKITFLGKIIYRAPRDTEYDSTDGIDFYGASDQSTYSLPSTQADPETLIKDLTTAYWHQTRDNYQP